MGTMSLSKGIYWGMSCLYIVQLIPYTKDHQTKVIQFSWIKGKIIRGVSSRGAVAKTSLSLAKIRYSAPLQGLHFLVGAILLLMKIFLPSLKRELPLMNKILATIVKRTNYFNSRVKKCKGKNLQKIFPDFYFLRNA